MFTTGENLCNVTCIVITRYVVREETIKIYIYVSISLDVIDTRLTGPLFGGAGGTWEGTSGWSSHPV